MTAKEELVNKIKELEEKKEKLEKEMQNPFLNITLRTKYKSDLPILIKEITDLKKRLLLLQD